MLSRGYCQLVIVYATVTLPNLSQKLAKVGDYYFRRLLYLVMLGSTFVYDTAIQADATTQCCSYLCQVVNGAFLF